jgi:hypothetical protein
MCSRKTVWLRGVWAPLGSENLCTEEWGLKARSSITNFANCDLTDVPEGQLRVHALLGMYHQRMTLLVALAGKPAKREVKQEHMESRTFEKEKKKV